MKNCTSTILHLLNQSAGYDISSPHAQRLAKKLARNEKLQHYANALESELARELDKVGTTMLRRSAKSKLQRQSLTMRKNRTMPDLEIKMRIPNLMAGKPFQETIVPLENIHGEMIYVQGKKVDDIPGLNLDGPNFQVSGCIDKPGDYEIELYFLLLLPSGEKQRGLGRLKMTVIADPRSLWKNLPSDTSARFHKPDIHSDSCENDRVLMMGSSIRGRSHAHRGIHRDDDFKLSCSAVSDWNVLCVADGAGSCKYSRRGAEVASLKATQVLKETLTGHYGEELVSAYDTYASEPNETHLRELRGLYQHTIVRAVFDAARAINEQINQEEGDKFKDFSTTLLLAAHKAVENGHLVVAFWIGDGGAVIYDKDSDVVLLGEPDSGEFAGQTRFLDNKIFDDGSVYQRVMMTRVDSMTALILATDGITDARFETEKQLNRTELWHELWAELEPMLEHDDLKQGEQELTEWMDFWSPGNHDDRTLAICRLKTPEKEKNKG